MNFFPLLPDHVVNHIYSYYNPYRNYYTKNILVEMRHTFFFKKLMKELSQFVVYNQSKNMRRFCKYSILQKTTSP
jgi:hypothetical protein